MSMNFRKIFVLGTLAFVASVSVARAQFAVYGTVSAERMPVNSHCTPSTCAETDGVAKPYGGTIGAYYDFRTYGPIRLGIDIRGNFLNANKSATGFQGGTDLVRHYSGLGGLRAEFRTPFKVLRPYVQGSAGLGHTNAISGAYQNYTQVQGFAGLDLALFDNVDFRAIEVGAGELFGSSSHSIQTIGLGIVFHTSREK